MYDYLIVGTGLTGSILAERLANMGKKVLIIDKRSHIGGNCYDYYNEGGVLVQKYGIHTLFTDNQKVFKYLSRFTKWHDYAIIARIDIDGKLYPIPINRTTLNKFFKINLKNEKETKEFLNLIRDKTIKTPKNSEEEVVSKVGWLIYDKFFKNYTKKQWGKEAKYLSPYVCSRIPIRLNTDERKDANKITKVPKDGFTKMFNKMLSHKNISIILTASFNDLNSDIKFDNIIWTGKIDEYFNYKYGALPYRSLKFEHKTYPMKFFQKYAMINYPGKEKYTRIVEFKHLTKQKINKTTITKEYPTYDGEPYYPILSPKSEKLRKKYCGESKKLKNVYFAGRLGTFKYLNMAECTEQALNLFEQIKSGKVI